MLRIAFAGGKGGISKSTLARAVAVRALQKGIRCRAYDMDDEQATFIRWNKRRQQLVNIPQFPVEPVSNVLTLRKRLAALDNTRGIAVVDTGAYWSASTSEVAAIVDVLVLSSRYSLDDMDALVRIANAAVAAGVAKEKIIVVFASVPDSPAEDRDARGYLESLGFYVVAGNIPFNKSFSQAQDAGLALTENRFPGPRTTARLVIDEVIRRAYEVAAYDVAGEENE